MYKILYEILIRRILNRIIKPKIESQGFKLSNSGIRIKKPHQTYE